MEQLAVEVTTSKSRLRSRRFYVAHDNRQQVAQLSQRDRAAAACVGFGQSGRGYQTQV